MQIACKKIKIRTLDGVQTFEIGKSFEIFTISHITVELNKKYVMIRDEDNFKKIYHFVYSEIDVDPNTNNSAQMNVKNLI